ncbi:MAG: uroporphyrinogen-III C-methyltransferase [Rhodospirillaceae bacterium]|nr:uroporphyrinogen-III C-methyltransferase [Rhodospirillaceae bacterium]MDD9914211.1 uroporphyrinogen-III C-methyltransferase [Rhodospirillaceae bacterium]
MTHRGIVHIVGAGPGDPELLTIRALRLLQSADVIVYDRLVGDDILGLADPAARKIFVGKRKSHHAVPQTGINALLVREAQRGRTVVRLKGGDPFIFGRGGEERDYLRRAGIDVTIVPGITAATGCAAASGIPLTHRDHAGAVTFVSGHVAAGNEGPDWAGLARSGQTLVFFMALSTAGVTARKLIEHGLDPVTPAAIVENGTLRNEKFVTGRLAELESLIRDNRITGPALAIIGDVAALAHIETHDREALAV